MKELNHTKYEDAFFRLTDAGIFTSAIIEYPDQWYEELKENLRYVKKIVPEHQKNFEREIIEQISRPINVRFYLLRIKERIESIKSELSIENMKEIKHTYGQEGLTYVNSAYLFLEKVKRELLNFIDEKLKISGFDIPKNQQSTKPKPYGIPTFDTDQSETTINPQKIIDLLVGEEWKKGKNFINPLLKIPLKTLLTNSNLSLDPIKWDERGLWKLYLLIESFIDKELLNIDKDKIPEYMIKHFTFNIKADRKSILDEYNKASKYTNNENVFTVFKAKLTAVYGKLNVNT